MTHLDGKILLSTWVWRNIPNVNQWDFQRPDGLHSNLLLVVLVRGGLGLDAARPRLDLDLLPRPQARQVRAQVLQ